MQVGESEYFNGSLVKTRAAMVMAVQVQLKQAWHKLTKTNQQSKDRNQSPRDGSGRSRAGTEDYPHADMMNIEEFVEVCLGLSLSFEYSPTVCLQDEPSHAQHSPRVKTLVLLVAEDMKD